ncbi:MAG: cobalamin B12-binding domain-containing protein [Candidatus Jordarchaeum sp.]|uniref:cobalamin B12-binding domain-containing protein n=1 Tax=Candidatus Jordarchaeum sp. TaxID=2823881 RepID=UPI004049BE8F
MADKEKILEKLGKAVATYDEDAAMAAVDEAITAGLNPIEAITQGLGAGINDIGERFEKGEAYIPELVLAAEVMSKASEKLQEQLPKDQLPKPLATMVIGTVEGDIHDLGVSIVTAVFSAAGFKVYNIGADQPLENFIKKAEEVNADIIGASALMSNTLQQQRLLGNTLKKRGLRDKYIYMVGGGAFPGEEWCDEVGADGYATDVTIALDKAKKLIEMRDM